MRKVVTPGIRYLLFNMTDPVVGGYTPQKRKLRQAISLSVDSQAIIDLLSQGQGQAAEYIIPPGLFGYDKNYKNPFRRYDPKLTRAKQLLKEAGYPGGKDAKTGERLTLYFDNTATTAAGRQYVGLLEKQVSRFGHQIRVASVASCGVARARGQRAMAVYFVWLVGRLSRPGKFRLSFIRPQ